MLPVSLDMKNTSGQGRDERILADVMLQFMPDVEAMVVIWVVGCRSVD